GPRQRGRHLAAELLDRPGQPNDGRVGPRAEGSELPPDVGPLPRGPLRKRVKLLADHLADPALREHSPEHRQGRRKTTRAPTAARRLLGYAGPAEPQPVAH